MNQAQQAAFPSGGNPSDLLRLGASLNELVRTLVASGAFFLRPRVSPIILPRVGQAIQALSWGSVNRVVLTADSSVQLPRIEPLHMGEPLYLMKLSDASALKLVPSGFGGDRKTVPRINGAADLTVTLTGLYTLMNDGQNWFAGGGPP